MTFAYRRCVPCGTLSPSRPLGLQVRQKLLDAILFFQRGQAVFHIVGGDLRVAGLAYGAGPAMLRDQQVRLPLRLGQLGFPVAAMRSSNFPPVPSGQSPAAQSCPPARDNGRMSSAILRVIVPLSLPRSCAGPSKPRFRIPLFLYRRFPHDFR